MKKKIISIVVAASVLMTGVVSAASMWGSYKGNEIIHIVDISSNTTINPKDVPAISYNGRTMIPISMLGDIGIDYQWDQNKKTVEIMNSNKQTIIESTSLESKNNILKATMFKYMEDLGESLEFVKTGFDIDVLTKVSGFSPNGNTKNNLSNAIADYNEFIGRSDVKLFKATDTEVNKALKYYYDAIDGLKNQDVFITELPLKADANSISNYQFYSKLTADNIYSGNSIARNSFKLAINESLK